MSGLGLRVGEPDPPYRAALSGRSSSAHPLEPPHRDGGSVRCGDGGRRKPWHECP